MGNLSRDAMVGQRRDEANDGVGEAKAHRDQIWVAERRQFLQPIDASADWLDDAPVLERI